MHTVNSVVCIRGYRVVTACQLYAQSTYVPFCFNPYLKKVSFFFHSTNVTIDWFLNCLSILLLSTSALVICPRGTQVLSPNVQPQVGSQKCLWVGPSGPKVPMWSPQLYVGDPEFPLGRSGVPVSPPVYPGIFCLTQLLTVSLTLRWELQCLHLNVLWLSSPA